MKNSLQGFNSGGLTRTPESTKLDCHCAQCGRDFPGGQNAGGHCTVCHNSFTSMSGFDGHWTGAHGKNRRCQTQSELLAKGWKLSDDGNKVWRLPGAKGAPWWEKHSTNNKEEGTSE